MHEGQILGTTTSDESVTTDEKQFVYLFGFNSAKTFSLFSRVSRFSYVKQ